MVKSKYFKLFILKIALDRDVKSRKDYESKIED